jgi:PAS domain S-box-containing protein
VSGAVRIDGGGPVKILLVDDRREDLDVLRLLLDDPDYTLVSATSGQEALRHLLVEDFAVVVLDVLLPGMDGFEVATLIRSRERSRHTPILFLTAAGGEMGFIYQAYAVGGVDYLSKPIDARVLRAKIAVFAELFRKDRRILEQAEQLRLADQRQKEHELAELRRTTDKRYRNLADAIPVLVWTARPDGELVYANRRWRDYTGLDREQTVRWGWVKALHPEDQIVFETGWRDSMRKEKEFVAEARVRRRDDGEYRWHLCHAVPEHDSSGQCIGWVASWADTEDLRRAIAARDEFLAIASHELRTPLTTLDLALHSLRRAIENKTSDTAAIGRKLDTASRQVQRLDKLINVLLDVTRIAGRRAMIEPVDCDLARVTREVVERLQSEAERAGCQLNFKAPEALQGRWDPLRLEQLVTNLVSNAIRHGAGKPIDVTVDIANGAVRLVVADQGEGIRAEQLPLLFGRFQRLGNQPASGGLGLGLFISRHIAREHGGDITVASEPGKGAAFTVVLPPYLVQPTR